MSTWLRLTLVTMTVGGGFTGAVFFLLVGFSLQTVNVVTITTLVGGLLLHLLVLSSGLIFVHNTERIMPLVVAFAIQIPCISSPIVTYRFGDGLLAAVGLAGSTGPSDTIVYLRLNLGAECVLGIMQQQPWIVAVNLAPIALLCALAISVVRQQKRM